MSRQRTHISLEVSSWMNQGLTLRQPTANARLLTNDTRENIILSRRFFSNLLTLSYARYRKMAEHDFEKKTFLRNQFRKTDVSMPGLRPYVEQLTEDMNRGVTPRILSSRQAENAFLSPSAQSFLSRTGAKSDPTFNRRPQPFNRQIKTARLRRTPTDVSLSENPQITRPPIGRQMSRERLNRLAQPKGSRYKSAPITQPFLHSSKAGDTPTAEEVLAQVDQLSNVLSSPDQTLPEKPKSAADNSRFHHLMDVFTEIYSTNTTQTQSCKKIVASNSSLQDDEGHWKMDHPSVASQKTAFRHHRKMFAEKLHQKIDVFLIEVGV